MRNYLPGVSAALVAIGIFGLLSLWNPLKPPIPKLPTPPLPIYTYNVSFGDGGKASLKGNFIRSMGFCSEVWLNGRADTIICTPHIITEANGEAAAPEPLPEPKIQWRPA